MIGWLKKKKVPKIVAIPVGFVIDLILAIIITDFIRSLLELV